MMSSKCLSEEERKKYEKEFIDFLIQRIKHAGGSLQFHHLTGLLQQARFEIRDSFGTTKSELMKFLKLHQKIFQIDSVGIVTVITSSLSKDDCCDIDLKRTTDSKKPSLSNIERGIGKIIKMHTEFGIIKATQPIITEVHFKSQAFGGKDSLLSDSGLCIGDEVYFNAMYGHDDYDIKFRASKVWLQHGDGNENCDSKRCTKNSVSNHLEGEGIIMKIFSNVGVINVFGKENEIVIFNRSSVRDCDNRELTKFLKLGDSVAFSAERNVGKDSEPHWQATNVRKTVKRDTGESSHPRTKVTIDTVTRKIENEPGKIWPHSRGAIIKFGKEFSQLVDGDSCNYFLYGAEVSDIAFEFSDGDDVWFDAIKPNSSTRWKAVLVWVGEKPNYVNNNKKVINEEVQSFDDKNYASSSSNISLVNSNSSLKAKSEKTESKFSNVEHIIQSKNDSFHHSVNRKDIPSDGKWKRKDSKSTKCTPSFSVKKSNNKKKSEPNKENSAGKKKKRGSFLRNTDAERKLMYEPELKSSTYKYIGASCRSVREVGDISSSCDDDDDDFLETSQDNQDFGFQNILYNQRDNNSLESASACKFSSSGEDGINSTYNQLECYEITDNKRSSIKKFEEIDGEIVNLYCKAAIMKSSHLQDNITFVLNAFYINGKSVEDQQVIDLKEIIKVGDKIKFNCFEIIDDSGEMYQRVTMAWTGPKPKVYEMTPEEFINELDLSVTVNDDIVSGCVEEHSTTSQNVLAVLQNSEETLDVISQHSSLYDTSDDEMFEETRTAETLERNNLNEEKIPLDTHSKLLCKQIVQRLKSKGFISLDSQADFPDVLIEIINLVQKHCNDSSHNSLAVNEAAVKDSKNISHPVCVSCSRKKSEIFHCKNKTEKHVAVQTIITGGIVAQSIYTHN